MMEVYSQCAAETGTGQFARMKSHLAAGVNSQRGEMFDEASRQLLEQLLVLHVRIFELVLFYRNLHVLHVRKFWLVLF